MRIPAAGLPIAILALTLAQAPRVSLTPMPSARLPAARPRARLLPVLVRVALAVLA